MFYECLKLTVIATAQKKITKFFIFNLVFFFLFLLIRQAKSLWFKHQNFNGFYTESRLMKMESKYFRQAQNLFHKLNKHQITRLNCLDNICFQLLIFKYNSSIVYFCLLTILRKLMTAIPNDLEK